MVKILISGYYGFNNIGDESILLAVTQNLRQRFGDTDITILSKNPESTAGKFGASAVDRKSFFGIVGAVRRCDLLISGGGSLLQDATSKRSILYYLFIIWLALLFRKKIFIYSQGIGPISSNVNRRLTAATLKRTGGIVVRDNKSKEFLVEIGVPAQKIQVAADPVISIGRTGLEKGMEILLSEGYAPKKGGITVGWAIKSRLSDTVFIDELEKSIKSLIAAYGANVVLIPFHFTEDMAALEELERRLGGEICCLKHKYLTEEMLSIIGNTDILVGVRLHSLIYAAIMGVPMIGIAYDPKINSFMYSLGMKAACSVYDFNSEFFLEEFERTLANREGIKALVAKKIKLLREKLSINEELIAKLINDGKPGRPDRL